MPPSQVTEPLTLPGFSTPAETGPGQHSRLPNFGNPAHAEAATLLPGTPNSDTTYVKPVTVERDIISDLVAGASAAERAFADHLLAAGVAAGWSCAELLKRMRDEA